MSSTRFFRFPWADSGDKTAIPDTAPPSGAVSYPQGFGPDYERDPGTDPLAKRVPRDETNQLYHDITTNLRAWQVGALPEWVTAAQNGGTAVTYPVGAMVRHDQSGAFLNYVANVETDEEPGVGSDWSVVFGSPGIVPYQSVTDIRNDPPAMPALGDAYIVGTVPTGAWVGQDNAIAYWNGTSWTFAAPTPWMLVGLADRTDWRWEHQLSTPKWVLWGAPRMHEVRLFDDTNVTVPHDQTKTFATAVVSHTVDFNSKWPDRETKLFLDYTSLIRIETPDGENKPIVQLALFVDDGSLVSNEISVALEIFASSTQYYQWASVASGGFYTKPADTSIVTFQQRVLVISGTDPSSVYVDAMELKVREYLV